MSWEHRRKLDSRMFGALGVALAVHAIVVLTVDFERPRYETPAALQVVLNSQAESQPPQPADETHEDQPLEPIPKPEPTAPTVIEAPFPDPPSEEMVGEPEKPTPERAEQTAPTTLDLTRPDGGYSDDILMGYRDEVDEQVAAFRPAFRAQLEDRRAGQARSNWLAARRQSTQGMTPDEYNAIEGTTSNHLKTDAGCFTKQVAITGEFAAAGGGGYRWYRTACKEILVNPYLLPEAEVDALGRAVPPRP